MKHKWLLGICCTLTLIITFIFPLRKVEIAYPYPLVPFNDNVKVLGINRAHHVTLHIDGVSQEIITPAQNVQEFLSLNKIVLDPFDIVTPDKSTPITDNLVIHITRVKEEVVMLEEEIPFKTERIEVPDLAKGESKIIQKGKNGLSRKTFVITYHNNQEVARKLKEEVMLRKPVNEIIHIGSKQVVQRGGKNLSFKETLIMKASAYTHTGNKTATGTFPKRGTVAVDPDIIPLGTKLYVDGYGYGVAQDIGGAIKGNRIDLFMETRQEALDWGLRTVRVYILE
ncbi:MAG: DUF348 domain-containing protein [Clostridia bacterium]|nr:DUF348 domain-containing protein [Clostridia bacterium]